MAGTGYSGQISFRTPTGIPDLVTDSVFNISLSSSSVIGKIINGNGDSIKTRGFCWSLSSTPTINDSKEIIGSGLGIFYGQINNLLIDTAYYVRAFATTNSGTWYSNVIKFKTLNPFFYYPLNTVFCASIATDIVDVTNSITGKTWMDRNLGASQVATSTTDTNAYGNLYQWGRRSDGHQCRNSATTTIMSSTDQPSHGNFITRFSGGNDWRSPINANLWQGVNGVNNPCPIGYRLPTETELNAERLSWNTNNAAGAFASPLKLPMAGRRENSIGSLLYVGTHGNYWSSSVSILYSHILFLTNINAGTTDYYRASGHSVRCIKN
jgi:uncharacterized protein (TIGR02145 family)